MTTRPRAVIVSAVRTLMSSFNGLFSSIPATKLGSLAIAEAVKRPQISSERIDEIFMGCVISARLGQAPARQAAIGATGERILTTFLHAMEARDARRGLASLCIGGGQALAVVERR